MTGFSAGVDENPPRHILAYRETSRLLHKYDSGTKTWNRFTRVPRGVVTQNAHFFSHRGDVYLASASGLTKFTNGSWTRVLSTGLDDGFCRIASHSKIIYLVTKTAHFEFNTKTKTSVKYNIPGYLQLSVGFAVAASDEYLYAVGGSWKGTKAIEFNFSSKVWEPISEMLCERSYGAALFYNRTLVSLGGYSSSSVEYYEPSIDMWTTLAESEGKNVFEGTNFEVFVDGDKLYIFRRESLQIEELKLDFSKTDRELTDLGFKKSCTVPLT